MVEICLNTGADINAQDEVRIKTECKILFLHVNFI